MVVKTKICAVILQESFNPPPQTHAFQYLGILPSGHAYIKGLSEAIYSMVKRFIFWQVLFRRSRP
jgi:hypothetical protein